ncbi:hypothetical protein [Saccharothrix variisporea]|uniref:Uncharacterized protein n=1 Tax=Saccharothrix variisporea TaxID=543527 RepID=A0A495XB22_9PSEU|nr:hypothetical protein [Saccharothrix variisporea]RKT70305.1 hypothetical protein DFJ66_3564 [Saccharothrix variisporea]
MTRPLVLLAPSYGNPRTIKRFQETIENEVEFASARLGHLLEPAHLDGLRALHPSGFARFWGATAKHDADMDRLTIGDIVVLVGGKKVRAAGEIGFRFRNPAFADELWDQYEDGQSFVNVYTVTNLQWIDRPIEDLWAVDGFRPKDFVYGQRLLQDERAGRVLRAFGVRYSLAEATLEARLNEASRVLGGSKVIPVENTGTSPVVQRITARVIAAERVEAQLVQRYRAFHSASGFTSFRTPAGHRADLYLEEDGWVEIVEAKSLADHDKVREAAAQLLDYAAQSPKPVTRLTALFPERPADGSVRYLHRLGIDCVHHRPDGLFVREDADDVRRQHMLPVWHGPA